MVMSSPLAGAEMMTLLAPAAICFAALALSVKMPVLSMTTSTPSSPQGSCAGSRSDKRFDLIAVYNQRAVGGFNLARVDAVIGIVAKEMRHRIQIAQIVEGDHINDIWVVFADRFQHLPADASKSVDADANRHVFLSLYVLQSGFTLSLKA